MPTADLASPADRRFGPMPISAALPSAVGVTAVAGCVYLGLVDPDSGGGLGSCPIREATGRWCPGCGLSRALHHGLRGDVSTALRFNALGPLFAIALIGGWTVWFRWARSHALPSFVRSISPSVYVAAAGVLVVFTVVRNLAPLTMLRGGG